MADAQDTYRYVGLALAVTGTLAIGMDICLLCLPMRPMLMSCAITGTSFVITKKVCQMAPFPVALLDNICHRHRESVLTSSLGTDAR